jgi:hypothetical protein
MKKNKMKKITIAIIIMVSLLKFANAQSKVEVEFRTGEDDLSVRDASVQENLKITINFKNGSAPVVLLNANNNQNWPRNSIRRVTIPLSGMVDVNNLASIEIRRGSTSNSFEDAIADNWDLKSLTVTATIKQSTGNSKFKLLEKRGIAGEILNRFKGGKNCNCFKVYEFFTPPQLISGSTPWIDRFSAPQKTNVTVELGVGGDDLRGGNDNARLVIVFKNTTDKLYYNNINSGENWGNFVSKIVSKDIPNPRNLKIEDIKEIKLWHTGGGGMGADNWDVDKFKLSITINGVSKILVDKVGAPLHRFTGDTRKRIFAIE